MNKKHLIVKKLDGSNLQDVMNLQQKIISGLHPDDFTQNRSRLYEIIKRPKFKHAGRL